LDQAENTYGNSPLQMAILNEDEVMAEEIAKKCSPDQINHRNFKGETSLHMAGFNGMAMGFKNILSFLNVQAHTFLGIKLHNKYFF
jgi:ankyrin repeat protein